MQGLGLEYAKRLVSAGARTLVLATRSPKLAPDTLGLLASGGVAIFTACADAADADSVAAVINWVHERLPRLGHVVHAAGVSAFHMLTDMQDDDLWNVARPKVLPCSSA